MCHHEKVPLVNTGISVFYFSGSGHSLAVARMIAERLSAPLQDICAANVPALTETAVVVFPVYAQAVPKPVKDFLSQMHSSSTALLATYGRMGFGNVLQEAAALCPGTVIAAGCVPTGHSYLPENLPVDPERLQPFIDQVRNPRPVVIPRRRKTLLARIYPELRGRLGIKIRRGSQCTNCGVCNGICPVKTMNYGSPGAACLRCLRCVTGCPADALSFRCGLFMRLYLRRPKCTEYFFAL